MVRFGAKKVNTCLPFFLSPILGSEQIASTKRFLIFSPLLSYLFQNQKANLGIESILSSSHPPYQKVLWHQVVLGWYSNKMEALLMKK